MASRKPKLYTFDAICKEVWRVTTVARSKTEAWDKIRRRDYIKLYSKEGTTPSGKTELVAVEELPPA